MERAEERGRDMQRLQRKGKKRGRRRIEEEFRQKDGWRRLGDGEKSEEIREVERGI
jgi:hypothetical protein